MCVVKDNMFTEERTSGRENASVYVPWSTFASDFEIGERARYEETEDGQSVVGTSIRSPDSIEDRLTWLEHV